MNYISTRDNNISVSSSVAISRGISQEGGLFVPEYIPKLTDGDIKSLCEIDYIGRAKKILSLYLTDFTEQEIDYCVRGAYTDTFDNNIPAPLKTVSDGEHVLELWHGPTCAFKDLALQLLPFLLTTASKKIDAGITKVILVATSGDTGKAALDGFSNVEGTKILVFYPENGVSAMQKLQMTTQDGDNVYVCAIKGNFDDAQSGVKRIFTNEKVKRILKEQNMEFSSANSINWGRLVPQIVYYVSAYCDLVKNNNISLGDKIDVVVPTGNFGNILAAYYAKQMGIPISKLVCASNKNNILTDFIRTGVYDRNRPFYLTSSPSMDILISSNLERLLYHLCDGNSSLISDYMSSLSEGGKYIVNNEIKSKITELFWADFCNEDETSSTINDYFNNKNYLCDTHTAVALNVYKKFKATQSSCSNCVIDSTASPYKFSSSVLSALSEVDSTMTEFDKVNKLSQFTNTRIPAPILNLDKKTVRFSDVCTSETMENTVLNALK